MDAARTGRQFSAKQPARYRQFRRLADSATGTQLAIGFQDVVEQPALEIIEQALQRSRIVGPERFALRSKLPGKLAMHGQMSQCMLLLIGQVGQQALLGAEMKMT